MQAVRAALAEKRERAYTTVMSLLNVMADKHLLKRERSGRAFIYEAHLPREKTLAGLAALCLLAGLSGSWGWDGRGRVDADDQAWHMPMYPDPAPPVDRTGAGDSFAGGFMGWLARAGGTAPADIRTAMILGSVLASYSVEDFSLERAAQQLGLSVREAAVTLEQPFVPGVGSLDEGVFWAFEEAEAAGDISPLFEGDGIFYVVELTGRTPEHVLPLEEAAPAIRLRVREQMKLERARQTARDMVDRIRQGATLDQVAAAQRVQVQEAGPFTRVDLVPGIGRANAVMGAAFGLLPGKVSGVVEENNALYIIELVEKTEASRQEWEAQKAQQGRAVTAALEEARIRQYMDELRDKAVVVDRRREARAAAASASSLPQSSFF